MARKLNSEEVTEYQALYQHYLFYVNRALENIANNGSKRKYQIIIGLMRDADNQIEEYKRVAYAGCSKTGGCVDVRA